MKTKLKKVNHVLIGMILIAQIFIVIFQANIARDIQLFGLSVFETFNIFMSLIGIGLTIYLHSEKKVFIKYIPYVFLLGVYLVLHFCNIKQFNNSVYPSQNPNFLMEIYYIFRIFIIPLILIFNIYYSGMKKEQIVKIIEIFVFMIAAIMVITNILCVAQCNYSERVAYSTMNIFDWFSFKSKSTYDYYELTTKGWFLSGNQMSAILFSSFPIVLYRTYRLKDSFHYILTVSQMLSMFMLGTKVANIGCLLILCMFFAFWILFKLLKHKEKSAVSILIISIFFAMLFPFSPVGHMIKYKCSTQGNDNTLLTEKISEKEITEDMSEKEVLERINFKKDTKIFNKLREDSLSRKDKLFVKQYVNKYCGYFGISKYITNSYDDIDSSAFWVRYLQNTKNNDYRVLKNMILKDIYERNNNPMDKYFGMGYTLNYIYSESDYTYQFYLYGIVGILLLIGPYFYFLAYVIMKGLLNLKKMFTLESAMYFSAPFLGLCVAKLSGHVLEYSFPLMVLGVLTSILLLHTKITISDQ